MIQKLLQIHQKHPLKSYHSTKEWSEDYFSLTKYQTPFDKALLGGFSCQQFSFAFLSGYQAALQQMFPTIAPNQLKALCVSEAKGGHPKVIHTTLDENNRINGFKTYITAGSEVEHLLVLCKTNEIVNRRPLLKMVHLPRTTDNIQITDFELPFMLEVKHGKLALKDTQIHSSQILEGDGYSQYTKPFRTLEDVLVATAYHAMLLRQAMDYEWEEDLRDQIVFHLFTLKNLLDLPPMDKETHLLLAAYEANFEKLLPRIDANIAEYSPPHFKEDWERNRKVLSLAKKVKELRLMKARSLIFG